MLVFLRPLFTEEARWLRVPPGGWLWLLFVAYNVWGLSRAAVPYDARLELLKLATYVGAYWAWAEMAAHRQRWRWLLGAVLLVATAIALFGLVRYHAGSRMMLFGEERHPSYEMRLGGTYNCPNHFANLVEMLIPFAWVLLWMPAAGWFWRLVAGYSLLVFLPAMLLSQSRSGWIGTAVGLTVATGALAVRRNWKWFLLFLLLAPLLLAAVGWALWSGSDIFRERVQQALAGNIRYGLWQDTWSLIQYQPWWGFGAGSYRWVFPPFRTITQQMYFNYAHNEYLHLLADYGAVGLGLGALAFSWAALRGLVLLWRVPPGREAGLIAGLLGCVAAALAHALFDFNFHIFANNHVLLLCAGTVAGVLFQAGRLAPWPLRGARLALPAAAAAGAAAVALLVLQVFVSYGCTYLGEQQREAFQMDRATADFRRAARIDPGNWEAYLGLANVRQTQGFWNWDEASGRAQLTEAAQLYERVQALNPFEMEVRFKRGKIAQRLGDAEGALQWLRAAVAFDPHHLFYQQQLARQLREMGRPAEALQLFRAAATIQTNAMVNANIRALEAELAAP